jgi:hypothetical protein
MYIPKGYHHLSWFALLLLGLYVGHNNAPTYDVVGFVACTWITSVVLASGIEAGRVFYKGYIYGIPAIGSKHELVQRKPEELISSAPVPARDFGLMNLNALETDMPKLRHEIHVVRILLDQYRGGLKVDLTEGYWIEGKRFGGNANQFRAMLANWQAHGIVSRKNGNRNSPYVVRDWDRLGLLRGGEKLPLHPSLY